MSPYAVWLADVALLVTLSEEQIAEALIVHESSDYGTFAAHLADYPAAGQSTESVILKTGLAAMTLLNTLRMNQEA